MDHLPRYASRPVGITAAVVFAILMAAAGRYGYHRDELYYLVAGRHLAWGYDDQPAFVPLLARLMETIAPGNLTVLRVPSALAAAAIVLLIAAIAREMGGERRAQLLAALLAVVAPLIVYAGHLLSTTIFDLLFSTVLVWLIARWIRTRQDRLLLAFGAVTGLALHNKALIAFCAAALALGLILTGPAVLRKPALWGGAALALLLWAPNLWWQAQHGWPQLDMAAAVRAGEPGGGRILLLPMQFILLGLGTAPIWLAGLRRLLRNEFRALGLASLILLGTFLVLGGQIYYPAGGYPALLAAGAVAATGWLQRAASTRAILIGITLTAIGSVLAGLPVYPVRSVGNSPAAVMNDDSLETVGWPQFADAVADVYYGLPPTDRQGAVILTGNYGEAGAIDRFRKDLPAPYSGHNAYWRWGPPPDTNQAPVLVAGNFREAQLRERCGQLELAQRFDNGLDVDNEEQGAGIWICRELRGTWSQVWPQLRHLS